MELEGKASVFRGLNFKGQIQVNGDTLRLDYTYFKKGKFYFVELYNAILEKDEKLFVFQQKGNDRSNNVLPFLMMLSIKL